MAHRYYLCFVLEQDVIALNAGVSNTPQEDFMIVLLVSLSGKHWLQISPLFSYSIHSKSLPNLSPLPASSMPVSLAFSMILLHLEIFSFLHLSYVPVLSSFIDVFFGFHDPVIVFLSTSNSLFRVLIFLDFLAH